MTLLGSYKQLNVLGESTRTAYGPAVPEVYVATALGDGTEWLHLFAVEIEELVVLAGRQP